MARRRWMVSSSSTINKLAAASAGTGIRMVGRAKEHQPGGKHPQTDRLAQARRGRADASIRIGSTEKTKRTQRVAEEILNESGQCRIAFPPYRQLSGSI